MDSDPLKKRCLENAPLLEHSTRKRSCLKCKQSTERNNSTTTNIESIAPFASISSLITSGADSVPMAENEPSILSRHCQYSNTTLDKSPNSGRVCQSYASVANNVKKDLIASLTSTNDLDIDFMIDFSNAAFASLSSFQSDFAALYDAVRDYIFYHCQLSEANKELRSLVEMIAHLNNLTTRSSEAAIKLSSTRSALIKAKTDGATLVTRISETRELLKELEEKLEKGDKEIDTLQPECDKLEASYSAAHAEWLAVCTQFVEKNKIEEHINSRCDEARAGIERTKALISSL
ncbi:hypothetical protein PanWU01x14_305560 [Parasponia andersonii]|uniref:Uncharacterized protein n=1 Tax=Parasponia andersonii TaxID=3476 RepID=A0A2P5AS68_PARAD|nr:hypothetical protein PanWU01x14_305560 [Parasponia andersonii]